MNRLQDLIYQALRTNDNQIRTQAEAGIVQLRDANPTEFFSECGRLIQNQQSDAFIKQSVGTVLGRLATMKNANTGAYYWDEVHPSIRVQVKNNMLSTLVSLDANVMKSGASAISQIASIEIPRNQWLELVDALAQNCMNEAVEYRNASLVTLGYICEQIKFLGQQINGRTCEQILGAIIIGTREKQNNSIIQTSITALRNSLVFLTPLLNNKKYRDQVFMVFFNQITNRRFIRSSYEALFQFSKACYQYIGEYLNEIVDMSIKDIILRDENTILALQLWDTIGTQYLDKIQNTRNRVNNQDISVPNYLQMCHDRILPQVMQCLIIVSKQDLDFSEMRESAVKTLATFAESCNREIIDKITEGISVIINSSNIGERQASALLFSTLCDYQDRNYIENCFSNGFQHLYGLLLDKEKIVVKNTLNGFVRLSEILPEVFLKRQDIPEIMIQFFKLIESDDQDLKVLTLTVLGNITDGLKQCPSVVSSDASVLLTQIVTYYTTNMVTIHQTCKQMNQKMVIIIMNIIMHTDKRQVIIQLIQFLTQKYYELVNMNIPDIQMLLQSLLSVLHTAILAHKNSIPNINILNTLCELVELHIKKFGVQNQGLSLISALAITFNKAFQPRSDDFWKYVEHGLHMMDQKNTFKTALICAGDFARIFETSFVSKASQVMNQLIDYIHNNIDRDSKIQILLCMGDLVLGMKQYGEAFIDSMIKISDLCFNAVYQLSTIESETEYVEELKETLVDMYACSVFALNSNKTANAKLFEHYPKLATFIVHTCNINVHPTVDYMKACLYLIFDSAAFFWQNENYRPKVKEITQSQQIKELVNSLVKFNNRPDIIELLTFIDSRKTKY